MYINDEELKKEVEYKFYRGSYGSGPDFHYYYEWIIKDVPIPSKKDGGTMKKTTIESMFGDSSTIDFEFVEEEKKLIISMTY